MAQEIIVDYKAEIDKITRDLEKFIDANEKLAKDQNKVQSELDQTTKAVDKLEKEFASAGKSSKAVNDNLKNFTKTAKTELSGVGSVVKSIGVGIASGIAAAFTVDAVLAFGKASINAFLEAEKSASKLRFAVTQVAGETEVAFQKLLDQSQKLRDEFKLFSDEDIQNAQSQLATFGLFSNQIEELVPRILEFATAQKVDVATATDTFIRALEGQTRGLVTVGAKFEDTGTIMGNYNKILTATEKLTGATAAETETLAGQLKAQEVAADELQETLGEKLAPVFVSLKTAVFEAVLGLLGFNKALDELDKKRTEDIANNFQQAADKIKKAGGDVEAVFTRRLEAIQKSNAEVQKSNDELTKQLGSRQTSNLEKSIARSQIESNNEIIRQNDFKIKQILQILDAEKLQKKAIEETLTAEQIRLKTTAELNILLEKNSEKQDAVSKDNVKLINLELAARKKLEEQLNKELAKRQELLDAVDTEFVAPRIAAPNLEPIQEQVDKAINKIEDSDIKLKEPDGTEFLDGLDRTFSAVVNKWLATNEEILNASINLFNQLVSLQNQFANQRIDKINQEKDAQLEALDLQTQAIDENLDKRRISEKDAEDQRKKLLQDRVAAEDAADKKIRAIKRRQAIINKIAAIAEIAISTAKNVAAGPVVLIPYWIALGAAQAAIVAAQPIPYKKGTKSAKGGLSLVDEEGTEAIYRGRLTTLEKGDKVLTASKTKTYGEALDAMIDNRFDSWVMDKYLAPRLEAQNKSYKSGEQKSFARNLADANLINVTVPQGKEMKSIRVNNLDELAAMILNSRTSPYR